MNCEYCSTKTTLALGKMFGQKAKRATKEVKEIKSGKVKQVCKDCYKFSDTMNKKYGKQYILLK